MTPIQIRAAQLLARGLSQGETATQLGISRRTISRWLCKEEFRNLSFGLLNSVSPEKVKPEILSRHTDDENEHSDLNSLVPLAIKTLRDILIDQDSRKVDKLRAATLLGEWAGLTSDFNVALASLRRYGLVLCESDDGCWTVYDQREKQIFDE
jgi:transcriptional regulator with XRE-family HTH domain